VTQVVGKKLSIHAVLPAVASGQLPVLGLWQAQHQTCEMGKYCVKHEKTFACTLLSHFYCEKNAKATQSHHSSAKSFDRFVR
jgi:hypothetical protein